MIRTDHYSLRFLLQQRLTTSPQQHWMSKLLGYDFTVEYNPGRLNVVADALSRRNQITVECFAISMLHSKLLEDIKYVVCDSDMYSPFIRACNLQKGEIWLSKGGLLFYKGKIFIPPQSDLTLRVLVPV